MLGTPGAWAQQAGATWQVQIEAPDDVRELLEKHLEISRYRGRPEVDALLLDRLIKRVEADARDLLATEGYFAPELSVERSKAQATHLITVRVVPGEPARIESVTLEMTGAIQAAPEERTRIEAIRQAWRLPPGARFRQSAWSEAKDALLNALVLDGYPLARLEHSEARVTPATASFALHLRADSGPLFHFGAISISGLERYPAQLVENLSPLKAGERYSQEALLRYQAALSASGYFRGASVSISPAADGPTVVPVLVHVTELPQKKSIWASVTAPTPEHVLMPHSRTTIPSRPAGSPIASSRWKASSNRWAPRSPLCRNPAAGVTASMPS